MPNVPTLLDSRLVEVGQRNFEAAAAAQKTAVERLGKIYEEGMRFANARMDANRKALQEIASCKSLPDVMPIWSSYFEQTAKQYSEEMEVLAGIVAEQAQATIEDTVEQVQEAADATVPAIEAQAEEVAQATEAAVTKSTRAAKSAAAKATEATTEAVETAADNATEVAQDAANKVDSNA